MVEERTGRFQSTWRKCSWCENTLEFMILKQRRNSGGTSPMKSAIIQWAREIFGIQKRKKATFLSLKTTFRNILVKLDFSCEDVSVLKTVPERWGLFLPHWEVFSGLSLSEMSLKLVAVELFLLGSLLPFCSVKLQMNQKSVRRRPESHNVKMLDFLVDWHSEFTSEWIEKGSTSVNMRDVQRIDWVSWS